MGNDWNSVFIKTNSKYGLLCYSAKAERWLSMHYQTKGNTMLGLQSVYAWLEKEGRLDRGGTEHEIIKFSSRYYSFRRKVEIGIEKAVECGCLERVKPARGAGLSLKITHKGFLVLEAWLERIELYQKNAQDKLLIKKHSKLKQK